MRGAWVGTASGWRYDWRDGCRAKAAARQVGERSNNTQSACPQVPCGAAGHAGCVLRRAGSFAPCGAQNCSAEAAPGYSERVYFDGGHACRCAGSEHFAERKLAGSGPGADRQRGLWQGDRTGHEHRGGPLRRKREHGLSWDNRRRCMEVGQCGGSGLQRELRSPHRHAAGL